MLESRLAELRHVEAELETIRQAHYAASDELHVAQGALAEASLRSAGSRAHPLRGRGPPAGQSSGWPNCCRRRTRSGTTVRPRPRPSSETIAEQIAGG